MFHPNDVRMTQPTSLSLTPSGGLPEARFHVELPRDAPVSQREFLAVNPFNLIIGHIPYENGNPLFSVVIILVKRVINNFISMPTVQTPSPLSLRGRRKQDSTTQKREFKIRKAVGSQTVGPTYPHYYYY